MVVSNVNLIYLLVSQMGISQYSDSPIVRQLFSWSKKAAFIPLNGMKPYPN